jgi:hypothetical protein
MLFFIMEYVCNLDEERGCFRLIFSVACVVILFRRHNRSSGYDDCSRLLDWHPDIYYFYEKFVDLSFFLVRLSHHD